MRLHAFDVDLQSVGSRHKAARSVRNGPGITRPGMQAQNGFRSIRTIQYTFRNHHPGATILPGRRAFLGWLEDEFYGAG